MRMKLSVLVVVATTCLGSVARAQDPQWQFSISPYLWLSSVDTELRVEGVPAGAESETDVYDFHKVLDFGLLVGGEARRGKFALLYDVQYLKLSDPSGETTGINAREVDMDITFAAAALAPGYRLIEQPKFTLDGFAGARVLYADVGLDVAAGAVLPAVGGAQDKTWVDPIVGAKFHYLFAERWALHGHGDIGGFGIGSYLACQLTGTVSYSFNKNVMLQVGYCLFDVEFKDGPFEFNAMLHGPIVGLTFSF
jgi:hypothetical protein